MKKFFTVLGGMGTLATESYIRLLNKRTPAKCDQDYLDYIIVNHATVPDRTAWILNHNQPSPILPLIEDIEQQSLLKPSFFVLICNTAHYAFNQFQEITNIPILNMIEETVNEIKKIDPNARRIGILATSGTLISNLYDHYIQEAGYEEIKPNPEIMDLTESLIYNDIKSTGHSVGTKYHELIQKMIEEEGADIVILGCTELSYAQEMDPETVYPIVDSQSVIVDRTIDRALLEQR